MKHVIKIYLFCFVCLSLNAQSPLQLSFWESYKHKSIVENLSSSAIGLEEHLYMLESSNSLIDKLAIVNKAGK